MTYQQTRIDLITSHQIKELQKQIAYLQDLVLDREKQIADLEATQRQLKHALQPFAQFYDQIQPDDHLDIPVGYDYYMIGILFRQAKETLEATETPSNTLSP